MMSGEQFTALLEAMRASLLQQVPPEPSPTHPAHQRRRMPAKDIRSDGFDGKQELWDDWAIAFRRTIRSMDVVCYRIMVEMEKQPEDVDEMKFDRA